MSPESFCVIVQLKENPIQLISTLTAVVCTVVRGFQLRISNYLYFGKATNDKVLSILYAFAVQVKIFDFD